VRQIRVIVRALHDPDAITSFIERLRHEAALARTGLGFAPHLVITLDGRLVDPSQAERGDAERFDDAVDLDLAGDVVAVAREGLANAARHAHSTEVTVRVMVTSATADGSRPGSVEVEVEDNGSGLPLTRDRHSGTKNLAVRARQHGGTFRLGPSPTGRGTLLHWHTPLT